MTKGNDDHASKVTARHGLKSSNYGCQRANLIAITQEIQNGYKYLSPAMLELVSEKLRVGAANGYSVATFYENFSLEPKRKYTINVCDGTACLDMMTHVMERYFTNTKDVMITDELCEAVMRTIVHAGSVVMQRPNDDAARGDLMWASMLAHNGLLSTGRDMGWASHQIEHQLSAFYDCAHGAGLAVVFPAWMTYTMNHDFDRYVRFATTVFQCPLDTSHPENTAKAGIQALRAFFQSLAMPTYLEDISRHGIHLEPLQKAITQHNLCHSPSPSYEGLGGCLILGNL